MHVLFCHGTNQINVGGQSYTCVNLKTGRSDIKMYQRSHDKAIKLLVFLRAGFVNGGGTRDHTPNVRCKRGE